MLLVWETGTLEFFGVFDQAESLSSTTINLVALGLLGGAVAKSAQIPLHTWLPDAMEGPTPVSALIHAATMVTAGVYLLVRAHPIFEVAVDVQHLAAILGTITLLAAGLIALVQWDIKRVIAYSTMSQIGYMFLAAGIGAYGYAIFHLMTHAFFKALLFMSAGVVIHHLDGEQDIRRMGGLKDVLPRTHIAFLVGSLALVGIPIFAGFWSKDGIISSALAMDDSLGWTLYVAALVGALLTGPVHLPALLHGVPRPAARGGGARGGARSARPRRRPAVDAHPRRRSSPCSRRSAGSSSSPVSGSRSSPGSTRWRSRSSTRRVAQDYLTSAIAVALGVVGFFLARRAFQQDRQLVRKPELWRVFEHKFYFDELYDALFYRPAVALADMLRQRVEEPVIERSLDEIGSGTIQVGGEVARVQSGLLRTYALAIAFAVAVLVVVFVAVR